jgi:hypothetical protein
MTFIKLTKRGTGKEIYVNTAHVIKIFEFGGSSPSQPKANLCLITKEEVGVEESPEDVFKMAKVK